MIPRTARGYEPLCAIYSRACASGIRERLDTRRAEAVGAAEEVRVAELGPRRWRVRPDGLLFVNVNTPHDYERAKGLIE